MNNTEQQLEILKKEGYQIHIKTILTQTFSLWFKTLFLNIFSILFPFSILSLITNIFNNKWNLSKINAEFFNKILNAINTQDVNTLSNFQVSYLSNPVVYGWIITLLFTKIIISPLNTGVIYCAYRYDTTGSTNFKDLISGFEGKKFLNLIALNFIYLLSFIFSSLFFYLPMLILAPGFLLAGTLIIIEGFSFQKAIKLSIQIAKINFFQILSITILIFFIGSFLSILFVNTFLFFITIPFSFIMIYCIYKDIFKIKANNNIQKN